MSALADQFTRVFREEHRAVRDALLDLVDAFSARDRLRIGSLLGWIGVLTGPHFRYEEEALYPGLVEIFGAEYIDKLLTDHDRAIGTAASLIALAQRARLNDQDVVRAIRYVRSILPHVSDCDGLSIMVERLPEDRVRAVFAARERCRDAGLDLLRWAGDVRGRPALAPE